jgi:hypothetical protein
MHGSEGEVEVATPLSTLTDQQGASSAYTAPTSENNNTKNSGPQSISID